MSDRTIIERLSPIHDYVLVRRHERPTSDRGIEIPEMARQSFRATVVQVGPGRRNRKGRRIPIDLEIGAEVELEPLWATEDVTATMGLHADPFVLDGVQYQVVPETRILLEYAP